ncbi:hypothetical protein M427DRAFT_179608 [Gonapodya prolifera JEL478]|uniref:Uncharacterized protein n=1 Tax=Gonapodya prolifera (strain JEL478) TaxID=1344416 RepID=A0A139AQ79_GONPJ|nr:hypothetical protein M427DRAFT_179608 [Gonapodya prolifera JEL478]|eukprot:KXS18921.1 hypothetical protein M427DRAFT_179608 [Gonapodya prolifera JEL478]
MSFIFWRYPGYFASWIFHSGLFLWKSVWDPQSVRKLRYLNDKDFCRLVEESFWALMMRKVDPEEGIESRFTASQTTPGSSLEYYQLGSWTELKLIDNLPYHGIYTYDFSAQFVLRVDKEIERGYAHSGPRLSLDWIELGGRRFQPDDGDAWEQAKVFVFHGCFSFSTWFYHSRIHFPLDAFNALARNILPHKGVVGRLLGPHLQLQVELDNAVLFGALSPLASEKVSTCSSILTLSAQRSSRTN